MPGIAAYGPIAEKRSERYRPAINLVIADESGAAQGAQEALRRESLSEAFSVVPALDDPRTIVARRAAADVLRNERDFDTRYELLRQISVGKYVLDDTPLSDHPAYDDREIGQLRAFAAAGGTLLVQSWTEYRRLAKVLAYRPLRIDHRLFSAPEVPQWTAPFGGDHIVIWAPESDPADVGLIAFGFEDLHTPTYVICRRHDAAGDLGLRATFVDPGAAQELLHRALVVVVADVSDPAPAVALARSGVPLSIPWTNGAHEYLDGAAIYLPWNARSVRGATLVAMSSRPPRIRDAAPGAAPPGLRRIAGRLRETLFDALRG